MRILFSIVLILTCTCAMAQKSKVRYEDEWGQKTGKKKATFLIDYTINEDGTVDFTRYRIEPKRRLWAGSYRSKEMEVREGDFVFFEYGHGPEGIRYVELKGRYENDERVGEWVGYDDFGKPKFKVQMNGEKAEGPAWVSEFDLEWEGQFLDNKRHGEWIGRDGETIIRKGTYKNGIRDGVWTKYDENGNKISEIGYYGDAMTGVYKLHYENGNLQVDGEMREDVKTGYWKYFYDSGQLHEEGRWRHGKRVETWKTYYPNGQKASEGDYEEGEKEAGWQYWDERGIPFTPRDEEMSSEQLPVGDDIQIFADVDKAPEYPGGKAAMLKFLSEQITYPEEAKLAGVEGTVYVAFTVTEKGKVEDVEALRGIGSGCDEEAVRVIQQMPTWMPGFKDKEPVPVRLRLPIDFRLQ